MGLLLSEVSEEDMSVVEEFRAITDGFEFICDTSRAVPLIDEIINGVATVLGLISIFVLLVAIIVETASLYECKHTVSKQIADQTLLNSTNNFLNKSITIMVALTFLELIVIFVTCFSNLGGMLVLDGIIDLALMIISIYLLNKKYTDKQISTKIKELTPDTLELVTKTCRRLLILLIIASSALLAYSLVSSIWYYI
jgi:hypothetical protein